jgi:hypothetical protein
MRTYMLLNLDTLKVIAFAWDCFTELEYYAAYDPDPVNTLITMSMFKPVEYLIEYLPHINSHLTNQIKLAKESSRELNGELTDVA